VAKIGKVQANRSRDRSTQSADILRAGNHFDLSLSDISQYLCPLIRLRATAHKTQRLLARHFLLDGFEHPAFVESIALQDRADQVTFAGFQADIEEHTTGIGVFEGGTVTVQPGGEDHAAAARFSFGDSRVE